MLYHKAKLSLLSVIFTSPFLIALPQAASAQDDGEDAAASAPIGKPHVPDHLHDRETDSLDEIVVSGVSFENLDLVAGRSVIEGEELQRSLAGQLGEVLTALPGVSATSFSPGASRPVLRGFSGERVRVLVDGIGTIDASNTSADHATSIDPLTAERVEVLRGPAVLLYGSQAIGGAVNVVDKRIPRRRLSEPVHIDALAGWDSASDLREGSASLDIRAGQDFVFHIDGSKRKSDNVDISGYALTPDLRADLLGDADEEEAEGALDEAEELRELANQQGVLADSFSETLSLNAGFAFFRDGGHLGAALGLYDTRYGVPTRPGTGHHHEEEGGGDGHEEEDHDEDHDEEGHEEEEAENISIDLRQYRADLRGRVPMGGLFEAFHTRIGYSDYTHTEFEGADVGTVFDVKGLETRAVLEQSEVSLGGSGGSGGIDGNAGGNWRGSIGMQYYFRDFDANGAEAYVPANLTNQIALFALQEFDFKPFQVEFAGRYEHSSVESAPINFERQFDVFSAALSFSWEHENGLRTGVNMSRAARAPSAEEMLSNGPHIATQAFEIGDTSLAQEGAWGLEGFVRGRLGPATVNVAIFQNWFDNYIYLQPSGEEEDELPVFAYLQNDARYFGVEGQVTLPLIEDQPINLIADLRGDYIRASLSDGTPLPRIPSASLLGALEAQSKQFDARFEVQWFDQQNRLADLETATDSFTHVNATLSWKILHGNRNLALIAAVNNMFDAQGRRHASSTKDYVPLSGRNFKLSLHSSF